MTYTDAYILIAISFPDQVSLLSNRFLNHYLCQYLDNNKCAVLRGTGHKSDIGPKTNIYLFNLQMLLQLTTMTVL